MNYLKYSLTGANQVVGNMENAIELANEMRTLVVDGLNLCRGRPELDELNKLLDKLYVKVNRIYHVLK